MLNFRVPEFVIFLLHYFADSLLNLLANENCDTEPVTPRTFLEIYHMVATSLTSMPHSCVFVFLSSVNAVLGASGF